MLAHGQISFKHVPKDRVFEKSSREENRLEELFESSRGLILRIKTAIPFDPTPDEVSVDINTDQPLGLNTFEPRDLK